jgi:predicted transcriptional regulator
LLHPELGKKLATLAEVCDRQPKAVPAIANEEWAA